MKAGGANRRAAWSLARVAIPLLLGAAAISTWEWAVRRYEVPDYLIPAPSVIAKTIAADFSKTFEEPQDLGGGVLIEERTLFDAWGVTVKTMFAALTLAVAGGVLLAMLFVVSDIVEMALFPYAVVLQVTPLIAIAPLLNVWLGDHIWAVLLLCAWIVAFFPILSNTVIGLKSADPNLRDLMRLYGATPWQRLRLLLIPSALPYFLAGLKVSANLSLVGAVVAEFVVGPSAEQTGLASVILQSGFRLEVPRMFAALTMISATGVTVYFLVHSLSNRLLSAWHDSAGTTER